MDAALHIVGFLLAMGVGMGCGSYATMPYYRLPNGVPCAGKWVGEKSACPKCGAQLRTRDLFPVFNWLGTLGKCFNCGEKINPIYFFIELSITVLSVLLYLKFGFDQMYIITLILATCLVILTAQDWSYHVMHNAVFVAMFMAGLMYRIVLEGQIYDMVNTFVIAVLVGLVFSKLYEKMKGKELGSFRYLKFLAVTGIFLNHGQLVTYLTIVALLCGLYALVTCAIKKDKPVTLAPIFTLTLMVFIFYPDIPERVLGWVK